MKEKYNHYRCYLLILFTVIFSACSKQVQQVTFALVPDTQTYSEKYPHILHSQVDWILKNKGTIDLVMQQGDLTQNNNDQEWRIVDSAFSKLNGHVPYVLAVGNHDMGSTAGKFADTRNTTLYNSYFPFQTMSKLPAFGGVFEPGKMDNAYYLLTTGKQKWMVLTLEFGPRASVLNWADKMVNQHPDRTVILNTHSYMYSDSTRQTGKDYWRPQSYGVGKDTAENAVHDGEQIWEKFVRKHENIRFVFSGHVLNSGVGTLVSINDAGQPVYQFLANFQEGVKGSANGGNGFLRLLKLDLKNNTIAVKTYSPFVDKYKHEVEHEFIIRDVNLKSAKK